MKGIFHAGPTIDPLFQMYLTEWSVSTVKGADLDNIFTLVIEDKNEEDRYGQTQTIQATIYR